MNNDNGKKNLQLNYAQLPTRRIHYTSAIITWGKVSITMWLFLECFIEENNVVLKSTCFCRFVEDWTRFKGVSVTKPLIATCARPFFNDLVNLLGTC